MKGFKKDGKFRPTGNRKKSSLNKLDMKKVEYTDKKTRWTYVKIIKNKGDEQRWNKFVKDNKKSKVRKKGSLSEKRKWEMRNGLNSMDIAESSVKQEGEIGEKLSDLQEHRLRRGVGSGDPESKTLDRIEGKFITEDKAKKYR